MAKNLDELEDTVDEQKDEIEDLTFQTLSQKHEIKDLQSGKLRLKAVIKFLRELTIPASKTTKTPHPPLFSESNEQIFQGWRTEILGKYEVNGGYLNNERARMVYTFGRTSGMAQKLLLPRFDRESGTKLELFSTAAEMIDYLASIYGTRSGSQAMQSCGT